MRKLGDSVANDIPVTNTELNWLVLYLTVFLDDHQEHGDSLPLKAALNGAKKWCSNRQLCDGPAWPKTKNAQYREIMGSLVLQTIFLTYHII